MSHDFVFYSLSSARRVPRTKFTLKIEYNSPGKLQQDHLKCNNKMVYLGFGGLEGLGYQMLTHGDIFGGF